MNGKQLEKIKNLGDNEADTAWIASVIEFFISVFGENINHDQTIVLMSIATIHTITLCDGTIINDEIELNRGIGIVDAAVIASVMCDDPDEDYRWWKSEFPYANKESPTLAEISDGMKKQLMSSLRVSAINPPM